ncbi:MAG: LamG domain-containing protein [Verrucomicrobiota bacterium]|jgi:hypothetical protein
MSSIDLAVVAAALLLLFLAAAGGGVLALWLARKSGYLTGAPDPKAALPAPGVLGRRGRWIVGTAFAVTVLLGLLITMFGVQQIYLWRTGAPSLRARLDGLAGRRLPSSSSATISPPGNLDGLVSRWHADGNARDEVGGNNGSLQNGVGYTQGKFGQAFSFTQDRQAVLLGNPSSLQLQDFTIVAWIRRGSALFVSADPDPGYQGNGVIFSFGAGGYGFFISLNGILGLSKIGYDHVDSNVSITDTAFHSVAVTKSGTRVVFYVDGMAYPAPFYDTFFEFSSTAAIGARGDNLHNGFIGAIDELSVHDRALTPEEIQADFQAAPKEEWPGSDPRFRSRAPVTPPRAPVLPER